MNCVLVNVVKHLTVGTKVVQQLQLSGSDVTKVDRLEEEEDELATEVAEVEGGGSAVAQAGDLLEKTERAKEMGETDRKRGIREEGRDEQQRVKYVDDDIEKKAPPSCQEPDSLARSLPPGVWRISGPGERE